MKIRCRFTSSCGRSNMTALLLAVSLLLSSCSTSPVKESTAAESQSIYQQTTEAADEISAKAAGSATTNVRLEDDYYGYQNNAVLNSKEIPADASSWSHFYELSEKSYQSMNTVLMNAVANRKQQENGSLEQKIADFYLTAMDEKGRTDIGLGELSLPLEAVLNTETIDQYISALGSIGGNYGVYSLISAVPSPDLKDSSQYTAVFYGSDLGPGKETLEDPSRPELLQEYQAYIQRTLVLAGLKTEAEAEAAARNILALQSDLAQSTLPLADQMNAAVIYNPLTIDELQDLYSNINIKEYIKNMNLDHFSSFTVFDIAAAQRVNDYLTAENLPLLKDYTVFCLIHDFSPYLSPDLADNQMQWKNYRAGIRETKAPEKICSEMVLNGMPFEFGRLYVEENFSETDKQVVTDMISEIMDAYKVKIDQLEWMSDDTKTAAKRKLETMVVKVGYPDTWPDTYDQVSITAVEDGGYLINNILALKKAANQNMLADSKKPVDRSEWLMPPQTVNAYYNPQNNEIVFPAAILQAPYYSRNADRAVNMGGIGSVIAHEISHAFDSSGALYDEYGNYNMWWTPQDMEKFQGLTAKVSDYYDTQEGFNGRMVNGRLTLTENIADLGGLSCVASIVGDNPEELRKMFRQNAVIWQSKYTEESMINRLNSDPHSPAKVRVNAVFRTLDAFYLAYPEIKEGDQMYLAPEDRVKVW